MLHPFMPYVTEEIYGMMPIKEAESIMISNYPVYNKKEVFTTNIDNVLEFITMFRNKKYCYIQFQFKYKTEQRD